MTLTATSFNVFPEPLLYGDDFNLLFTFTNTGTTTEAAQFVSLRLSDNDIISSLDERLASIFVPELAPGESFSGSAVRSLPAATENFWDQFDADAFYAIGVLDDNPGSTNGVDFDRLQIDDAYEENDTQQTAFDISNNEATPLSEIGGLGQSRDDDWYEIDVTNGFERLVVDLTHFDSQGDLDLEVYNEAGNVVAASRSITDDESIDVVLQQDGTHFLRVFGFGGETGQNYDLEWDDLFGGRNVDLVGSFFNVVQEPLDAGDTFTVNFNIQNTGTSASGAFDVDFRLSTNDFISDFDFDLGNFRVSNIAAGATANFSRSFTLPEASDPFWDTDADGNFAIGMQLDHSNEIDELNENNNRNVGEFDDYDTLIIDDTPPFIVADVDLFG